MAIDISKLLNPSQYKAATIIDRPVLVIAGAGSGKTRVIEYRSLNLIQQNINPASILLLSFTRKSSREMMQRASRHDIRCQQIDGGTFHSFAFKLLKRYGKKIDIDNNFSILDSSDSNELIGKCIHKLNLSDMDKRFPKKETVRTVVSKIINKQVSASHILEREYPQFEEFANEIDKINNLYQIEKLKANYLDYDDLLVYFKKLLQDDILLDKLSSFYQHIMVDEYQDTNKLQGDITYLLAKNHNNIMVVGDDAQSIYGFRGANHQNIMEFPVRFPNCEIIKLEQNYRSTQEILNLGNSVLENMEKKFAKNLVSASKNSGDLPEMLFFKNPYEEAVFIASSIKYMRDQGLDLKDQAVLFRSAYISIPLQAELSRMGIPFQVYGGMKFYETAHVKDLTAYLKILVNIKDELSWLRVLKLLDGVGAVTASKIYNTISSENIFTSGLEKLRELFSEGYKFSQQLVELIDTLILAGNPNLQVNDKLQIIFEYYKKVMKRVYDEWQMRESDLETIIQISSHYDSLEGFLADLALEPPEKSVASIDAGIDDERPLTLSTIHSAKGLEWDSVYIIGLIDGIFPSRFAFKFADQLEEEQRLFYVAVTRPKRKLYLSMHHEGNGSGFYQCNRVSRFLENPNVLKNIKQDLVSPPSQNFPDFVKNQEDAKGNFASKDFSSNQAHLKIPRPLGRGSFNPDTVCEDQTLTYIEQDLISNKDIQGLSKSDLFKKINDFWKK